MSNPTVGIVIVSHSARLAEGVVELAAQMAPDVVLLAAGGTDEGTLGSSFSTIKDTIELALVSVGEGGHVVLVADLGSAIMTTEAVMDVLEDPGHIHLAHGPLVEGAVAGAVAAQQGGTALIVTTAIEQACTQIVAANAPQAPAPIELKPEEEVLEPVLATVCDETGLHARPAALLARMASDFDADVRINGVDAASVLSLMGLGIKHGDQVLVSAEGPQAAQALSAIVSAIEKGLDPIE
ncbi:MAG: dihydroxyacetone kinase phosphoryl donor subunit DhaM [Actinomycetaceae bacterium]|nr:dihydroxyacetone kinase phosphoryl donor subunit DhaM [Actinomycetaceae bacterium]